jgi:hypothetical protein
VVVDGPVVIASMELSVTAAAAPVPVPVSLVTPSSAAETERLENLRAKLASIAREVFESGDLSVPAPEFAGPQAGVVEAKVQVGSRGPAKLSASGFTGGVISLLDEIAKPVCAYVRDAMKTSAVTPDVSVAARELRLAEGALDATPEAGAAGGAMELSDHDRHVAQWTSGVALALIAVAVAAYLILR